MFKVNRSVLYATSVVTIAGALGVSIFLTIGTGAANAGGFRPLTGSLANIPPAKAALLQAQAANAASAPVADKSDLVPITDQPGTPPVGGIENVPEGPFQDDIFAVQNSWGGMVGSQWLWVYAGQVGPANQAAGPYGGVALFSQSASGLDYGTGVTSLGFVTVPGLASSLQITGISGSTMTLTSASGAIYSFDLSTLTFTN